MIGGLDGDLNYVNPAFLELLGIRKRKSALAKCDGTSSLRARYADADRRALAQIRATGRCDVYEKAFVAKDGRHGPGIDRRFDP